MRRFKLLRPTDEELAIARQLGIDPGDMNGPQLRDMIKRAQQTPTLPSLRQNANYKTLVHIADLLGVSVDPGAGVATIKQRIEDCIEALFRQKGIHPGVRVRYADDYAGYSGKEVVIVSTQLSWAMSQAKISVNDGVKFYTTNAHIIALHAFVI